MDGGRDCTFVVDADTWIPSITDCVNKWVVQCKYSVLVETKIKQGEIYKEIVTAIRHRPDYYLLMTNRNVKASFEEWFSNLFNKHDNYIPLKGVLMGRQTIESVLNEDEMRDIRKKYFGF